MNELKKYALALGFDDLGVADATKDLVYKQEIEQAFKDGRFGPLDYLENTYLKRINIIQQYPQAKSVIIVVKNYYTGNHPETNNKSAKIARYAWGRDYHHWFKTRLKKLKLYIESKNGQAWAFNDTAPVLERAWAQSAGLGFIGKSAMFIHRDFGTWTFLGGLATNLEIAKSPKYIGPDCGSCTRCIDACPTNAIIAPHKVDANKCIATWTIERSLHKDSIIKAPREHNWAFGCDICQEVCPWNKFQKLTNDLDFQARPNRVIFTNKTLKEDLKGSPLNRAKPTGLLTNFLRIRNRLKNS